MSRIGHYIDKHTYVCHDLNVNKAKRITANLPEDLLNEATSVTKKGITETLIQGLQLIKRSGAYRKAQGLKGKLDISIDIDKSRERTGR
jgi:hypothetical protein